MKGQSGAMNEVKICRCFPSFLFSGPWEGASGPLSIYLRGFKSGGTGRSKFWCCFSSFLSFSRVLVGAAEGVLLLSFIRKPQGRTRGSILRRSKNRCPFSFSCVLVGAAEAVMLLPFISAASRADARVDPEAAAEVKIKSSSVTSAWRDIRRGEYIETAITGVSPRLCPPCLFSVTPHTWRESGPRFLEAGKGCGNDSRGTPG